MLDTHSHRSNVVIALTDRTKGQVMYVPEQVQKLIDQGHAYIEADIMVIGIASDGEHVILGSLSNAYVDSLIGYLEDYPTPENW